MSTLQKILANKTDKDLLYYVQNPKKHTEEAVRLALAELQKRNVEIPRTLSEELDIKLQQIEDDKKADTNSWTKNIVEDEDAPRYYSQTAIYIFSILFSVFFGSFLLATNSKDAEKPVWPVVLFGFIYSLLAIIILNYFSANTTYTFIANSLGVIIMYELFWKKNIGVETKYRTKPIWKPLIIAIVIFVPYLMILLSDRL